MSVAENKSLDVLPKIDAILVNGAQTLLGGGQLLAWALGVPLLSKVSEFPLPC